MNYAIYDFKSSDEFFYDEKKDLKNNTVRVIDLKDKRFQDLLQDCKSKNYGWIRINLKDLCHSKEDLSDNVTDKMYSFMRMIKHIAIYGDLMIITWFEKEDKGEE
jgi:hypothetical protein